MKHEHIQEIDSYVPIPENYKDAILLMQSDFYRCYARKLSLFEMYFKTFFEPSLKFLFWFRLSQVDGWLKIIAKFRRRHYAFKYGIMIPSSTKIGYGFFIGHPFGIIINHTAVIGNNVNVIQFLSIGSNEIRAAFVGDNVYIGPHCSLVEDVVVGHDSTIGAGAVVVKNIPPCSVAVGAPARAIHSDLKPGKYILRRWPVTVH